MMNRLTSSIIQNNQFDPRGGMPLLSILAWLVVITSATIGALQILFDGGVPRIGPWFGVISGSLLLGLLRLNNKRLAIVFFISILIVLSPLLAIGGGGVIGSAWVALPIATMTAGWLLGPRVAYVFSAFGVFGIAVRQVRSLTAASDHLHGIAGVS